MLLTASVLFSVLIASVSSDAACGTNQYYYALNNKCFFFPTTGYVGFSSGQSYCQQSGGQLASIHSADEDSFVSTIQQNSSVSYAWIGILINTTVGNNSYTWIDGSAVNYTNFGNTPSSNSAYAYRSFQGYWFATPSTDTNTPLCQRPYSGQIQTTPAPSNCPSGQVYSSYSNKCFQLKNTQNTFIAARSDCLKQGGDLASIHSYSENQLIANSAKSQGFSAVWIGFNRAIDHSSNYTWSDASYVNYQNWNAGVPGSCSGGAQDCVSVDTTKGEWFNCWTCNQKMPYVCEFSPSSSFVLQEQELKQNFLNLHPKNVKH